MLVAAGAKIRSELGWEPRKPELAEMIGDAWALRPGPARGLLRLRSATARTAPPARTVGRAAGGVDRPRIRSGLGGGQLVVGGGDPREERRRLRARGGPAPRRAPASASGPGRVRGAAAASGPGLRPPVANCVDLADGGEPEPAPGPLVGQRGVDEPVQQHQRPVVEQRARAPPRRAARGRPRTAAPRLAAPMCEVGVLDQAADQLGGHDAARLAQQADVAPRARQGGRAARRRACVLPAPSMPSMVISLPRAMPLRGRP